MKIRNVVLKGLRRFIEDDDESGLQPAIVAKIRRMVTFLQNMERGGRIAGCAELEGSYADWRRKGHMESVHD